MKKVLATILALVMALGLCSVSWAANPDLPPADENGVITLTDDVVYVLTKCQLRRVLLGLEDIRYDGFAEKADCSHEK